MRRKVHEELRRLDQIDPAAVRQTLCHTINLYVAWKLSCVPILARLGALTLAFGVVFHVLIEGDSWMQAMVEIASAYVVAFVAVTMMPWPRRAHGGGKVI